VTALTRAKLPLLGGQTSIWLAEQFGPLGRPYNARWSLSYDRDAVAERDAIQAVEALIAMHPAVSLRVGSERGVPYQTVGRPAPCEVVVCNDDDPDGVRTLNRLADTLASKEMKVESDPLAEMLVVSARNRVHILVFQHHLAMDGSTRTLLSSDLDQLARGLTPPHPDNFAEALHASHELELGAIAELDDSLEKLADADGITLPDHPNANGHGTIEDQLAPARSDDSPKPGPAARAVMAATVAVRPYCLGNRCLIWVTTSTRPAPSSRVAGCFVNTIAVSVPVGLTTEQAGANEAQSALRDATSMRHLPSGQLAAAARRRRLAALPAEQVLATATRSAPIPGFAAYTFSGARSGLTFRTWDFGSDETISLEYPAMLLSEPEASEVFERYRSALVRR